MIATLVIFLREGVEASMIVAILLAYLNRSGQRRHFRDVFAGVAAALVLAAAAGIWPPTSRSGPTPTRGSRPSSKRPRTCSLRWC